MSSWPSKYAQVSCHTTPRSQLVWRAHGPATCMTIRGAASTPAPNAGVFAAAPNAGVLDPKPNPPGLLAAPKRELPELAAPNAGVLLAPKPPKPGVLAGAPNAGAVEPKGALVAPKAGAVGTKWVQQSDECSGLAKVFAGSRLSSTSAPTAHAPPSPNAQSLTGSGRAKAAAKR